MESTRTRFVWKSGRVTWHKTMDCPYYPRWTIDVGADHPELPEGQYEFALVKPDAGAAYYREV